MFVEKSSRRATVIRQLAILSLISLTTGCAGQFNNWLHNGLKVGPDYMKPAAQVADEYPQVAVGQITDETPDYSEWWTVFNDPVLNRLIEIASQQGIHNQSLTAGTNVGRPGPNPQTASLRQFAMRVEQARAALGIARGNLLPQQQGVFFDYQKRQGSRETFPTNQAAGIFLPKRSHSFWDLGMSAVWEIDLWGRFRRAVEADRAQLDFTIEEYDLLLVSILADVAQVYYDIRTLENRIEYAQDNIEAQAGALKLAQTKFDAGATTELDVQQARTNLANTQAGFEALQTNLLGAKSTLCFLLGMPPNLDVYNLLGGKEQEGVIPSVPPQVAVGIPADLMRRRPDLRAIERRVARQSAIIGVAASDLFPTVTILGSVQYEAEFLGDLVSPGSVAGVFGGPSVSWPILNYNRIRNNINFEDAKFQELAALYEMTVLSANNDVSLALNNFLGSQRTRRKLAESVEASKRSVEIALTQYRGGIIDFNRVFTLQAILAQQQDQLAEIHGTTVGDLIQVYRNLGGGWQIRLNPPPKVEYAEAIAPPAPENGPLPNPPAAGNNGAPQDPVPMPGNGGELQPMPMPEPPADPNDAGPAATMIRFLPPESTQRDAHAWKFPAQPEVVPVGHWEWQPPLAGRQP